MTVVTRKEGVCKTVCVKAFSAATFLFVACVPAGAQQTTGTPGAPNATTGARFECSSDMAARAVRVEIRAGRVQTNADQLDEVARQNADTRSLVLPCA
jgi:hypothetical protein